VTKGIMKSPPGCHTKAIITFKSTGSLRNSKSPKSMGRETKKKKTLPTQFIWKEVHVVLFFVFLHK
jgi:hypothetical protein